MVPMKLFRIQDSVIDVQKVYRARGVKGGPIASRLAGERYIIWVATTSHGTPDQFVFSDEKLGRETFTTLIAAMEAA